MNQAFAKCVISYLPNFNSHSRLVLLKRLVDKLKISQSAAERNVRTFELYVERRFWEQLLKIINQYADRGVNLHVLGQGIKTFYPRIAFICGDDPSQHRISGLSEGMASYSCTFCNHKSLSGLVYDPLRYTPRDILTITQQCAEAEQIMKKIMRGQVISKMEKIK
jgi:hypothetical protein